MKTKKINGRTLAAISTFIIFAVCLVSYVMYAITSYYLYFFLFITALFGGATNVLFLLLKREDTRYKNPKAPKIKKIRKRRKKKEVSEEIDEEHDQQSKQRKRFYLHKLFLPVCLIAYIIVYYNCSTSILSFAKTVVNGGVPAISNIVPLIIILILVTVFEKLCKYSTENNAFVDAILQNCRAFFRLAIMETVLAIACLIVENLQLFHIQKYIGYLYTGVFFYYLAFVTISLLVTIVRKELIVSPYIVIPIPLSKNQIGGREQGFLDYLEENTGITIRGLWSIKYIREIAPVTVFMIGLLLWISTAIVQVNSEQQAAVYRLGKLQNEILEPGIHLTLPYPIDKVEIYNTDTINKVTIGYKSEQNTDNVWTESHQGEEYILLLGGGDEVVSINLRLEYKISDLKQYLTTTTSPESVMQALAYELVTDQTISTNLSSLMSADRDAFSENFRQQLTTKLEEQEIGLEVVAVILESIHPPVDIAMAYQELISAEIQAQKYIADAQAKAAVTVAQAESTYDTTVSDAQIYKEEKVASAKSNVEEFLACVEAYNKDKDAYTFYKYLAAVREAYGNANLVIVGKDVDTSALYFGNLFGNTEEGTTEDSTTEE